MPKVPPGLESPNRQAFVKMDNHPFAITPHGNPAGFSFSIQIQPGADHSLAISGEYIFGDILIGVPGGAICVALYYIDRLENKKSGWESGPKVCKRAPVLEIESFYRRWRELNWLRIFSSENGIGNG